MRHPQERPSLRSWSEPQMNAVAREGGAARPPPSVGQSDAQECGHGTESACVRIPDTAAYRKYRQARRTAGGPPEGAGAAGRSNLRVVRSASLVPRIRHPWVCFEKAKFTKPYYTSRARGRVNFVRVGRIPYMGSKACDSRFPARLCQSFVSALLGHAAAELLLGTACPGAQAPMRRASGCAARTSSLG